MTSLSFKLPDDFISRYRHAVPPWGFPIGGDNSLGELTFLSKYSRLKSNGAKEEYYEVCRRVIEGTWSILRDHCAQNRTPWNETKAQSAARDAYERMFCFKWLPPGRGLWMMGTSFVHDQHNSAPLQNCAFISTEKLQGDRTLPFVRLMEMSMLGIGVGFDTKGAGKFSLHEPTANIDAPTGPSKAARETFVIADSREGWCESLARLLRCYFYAGYPDVQFDYSLIRPAGQRISGFGGVAAGSKPLSSLHDSIRSLFANRLGEKLTASDIVDVMNLAGKCVVSGNVRRSAEIALGDADDVAFLDLKVPGTQRMGPDGWGHTSNNSVFAHVGGSYDHIAERIAVNGEPGLLYLDLCQDYGRLADPPNQRDYRAAGTNPCGEQTLESFECCTLVETFPVNHVSLDDWIATLKLAYLYAKAVTLLPTHWPETNEIMQRNRRIGCSVSGQAQFAEQHSVTELRRWLSAGYAAIRSRDVRYSEWLGVRESIKTTSVKPSGTVSLLAGVTPGVHWPTAGDKYVRRIRYAVGDVVLAALADAGYPCEPDVMDPAHTVVVSFPVQGPAMRDERDVSVWEKAHLAALHQRFWADNQVSCTLTFEPIEVDQVPAVLRAFDGQLKSVAMLPLTDCRQPAAYKQMPYESVDEASWEIMRSYVRDLDWDALYASGRDAEGESLCANDRCELERLPA